MDIESKQKLEKLMIKNKIKQAQIQLISDLNEHHGVLISDRCFVDYQLCKELHKRVYEKIKSGDIKAIRFQYEVNKLKEMLNWIFNEYRCFEDENVLFYPSTFGYYFRSSNRLYLDYPIATKLPFTECRSIISKLMNEMHDDLIVIAEDFSYGFVMSEDEYLYVTIEYWGV
ncbi:MAG: hypothetical protein N2645_15145 [Clostridia bacterium]|nr:hypothetical protein [Clostridia bacterium]